MKKWFFYSLIFFSTNIFAHTPVTPLQAGSILFTENKGQWRDSILFSAEINGGYINLLKSGFDYTFADFHKVNEIYHGHATDKTFSMHWLKVRFLNSNIAPSITKSSASIDYANYITGNNSSQWVNKAYNYKLITYTNLYNGVDLNVYSKDAHLKYDLTVVAGADISKIKLQYDGANDMQIINGELQIKTGLTDLFELKPIAWQMINGLKVNVDCNYTLSENQLGFQMGINYNAAYPLVIDPEIVFSSYTGSRSDNWGYTATYDSLGNAYAGGIVYNYGYGGIYSPNQFSVSPGAYVTTFSGGRTDITIFKFSSDGKQRLYATYLGGDGTDIPQSMVVDHKGNLIILGNTGSNNFPMGPTPYHATFIGGSTYVALTGDMDYLFGSDIFLAKLSEDGSQLLASTYIGGTELDGINVFNGNDANFYNYGDDFRGEVIVDKQNNVYAASTTLSNDFPVTGGSFGTTYNGSQDAIVFKLSPNLNQLLFSGYFGGSDHDAAFSLQLDSKRNIFFGGGTLSSNIPTSSNALHKTQQGMLDAFVAKIDSMGSTLLSSTYLGTSSDDQAFFVQTDINDYVYAYGQTWGQYPISQGVFSVPGSGQFIHKLSNDLSATKYSTVFGSGTGTPDISPTAFLVSDCGLIFISGWMGDLKKVVRNPGETQFIPSIRDMPISTDAYQPITNTYRGFYFATFAKNMEGLDYGTYFGGIGNSRQDTLAAIEHVDGGTSRFDKSGKIYQAICAGCNVGVFAQTPTTPNVWSVNNQSFNCNELVVKFDFVYEKIQGKIVTEPASVNDTIKGLLPSINVSFQNQSSKKGFGTQFFWYYNKEVLSRATDIKYPLSFFDMGITKFQMIGIDTSSCYSSDTATVYIQLDPTITGGVICRGDSGVLHVTGGSTFHWTPEEGLSNPFSKNPKVYVKHDSVYTVFVTNGQGYNKTLRTTVKVINASLSGADFNFSPDSSGAIPFTTVFNNKSLLQTDHPTYLWRFGDGSTTSTEASPFFTYDKIGRYKVELVLTDSVGGCPAKDSISRFAYAYPKVNDITYCEEIPGTFSIVGGTFCVWKDPAGVLIDPRTCSPTITISGSKTFDVVVYSEASKPYSYVFTVTAKSSTFPYTVYDYSTKIFKDLDNTSVTFEGLTKVKSHYWNTGNNGSYTDSIFTTNYVKMGTYPIIISGIDTNNCAYRTERLLEIDFMLIPNVFTPNGDQVNESFAISGLTPGTATLEVFNRWGSKVFDSGENNYNNNWSADNQADGVYFYNLKLNYRPEKPYKGWVQVVR